MEKRSRSASGETLSRSRPPSRPSTRPSSRQPPRPPSTISFALSHQERIDECPSSRIRITSGHARTRRTSSRSDTCPSPRHGRNSTTVQSPSGRPTQITAQSKSGETSMSRSRPTSRPSPRPRSCSRTPTSRDCLAPSSGRKTVSKARLSKITISKEPSAEERKSTLATGRNSRLSIRTVRAPRTHLRTDGKFEACP